jgi:hypothetical protein
MNGALPITFVVPKGAVDIVKTWARGLRGWEGKSGQVFERPYEGVPGGEFVAVKVFVPNGREMYLRALGTLTAVDIWCLRQGLKGLGARFAPLYTRICYRRETPGREEWLSTPALYRFGYGDCEDLTGARCAERLLVGDTCRPDLIRQTRKDGGTLYHVVVRNPDGSIEDPSGSLGMWADEIPTRCVGISK